MSQPTPTPTPEPTERRIMSAVEFIKIWKGENTAGEIRYERFYDRGCFDKNEELCVRFINIQVDDKIEVNELSEKLPNIILTNCKISQVSIKSHVSINKLITGNFLFNNNSNVGDIYLENSQIDSISIRNNSTIDKLEVIESTIDVVEIENSVGNFLINENSHFRLFNVLGSKLDQLYFRNGVEINSLEIKNNSTISGIEVSASAIGSCVINNSNITGFFSICTESLILGVIVENSRISDLSIENGKISEFFIKNSHVRKIEISKNSYLRFIQLFLGIDNPAQIILKNSQIASLDLNETIFPEFGTFSISDCEINLISIINFINYGTLVFNNLKPLLKWEDFDQNTVFDRHVSYTDSSKLQWSTNSKSAIFRVADSDLGNLQFINCNLRTFDHFEFRNAKLLNVFVAGSQMPDAKAFRLPGEEQPPELVAEQKRLAFGQFKKIYENQGDRAGSLRYLAYEMDAYMDMLWMDIKELKITNRHWWGKIWDLAILLLNKVSSNHGNNWVQGAFFTVLISVLCFVVYLNMLGYKFSDWGNFWDILSYTPQYLNPFRDEDSSQFISRITSEQIDITAGARIWDYFSRVIVAYFIYQTIQAFRKLGRSSG